MIGRGLGGSVALEGSRLEAEGGGGRREEEEPEADGFVKWVGGGTRVCRSGKAVERDVFFC